MGKMEAVDHPAPVGVATGKVMLFGEYAVLDGAPSLLSATPQIARAKFQDASAVSLEWSSAYEAQRHPHESPQYWIDGGSVGRCVLSTLSSSNCSSKDSDNDWSSFGETLIFAKQVCTSLDVPKGYYNIDTSQFGVQRQGAWQKMGIGSSGAATAAMLHLLSQLDWSGAERLVSPEQRLKVARELHTAAQGGIGSGADLATSVYQGLINYRLSTCSNGQSVPRVTALTQPLPNTYCVWRGGSTSTVQMVREVRRKASTDPAGYREHLDLIREATQCAMSALNEAALKEAQRAWYEAVYQGGQAIKMLSQWSSTHLWTATHERWMKLVNPLGGAIKPSGAGGDDLSILTSESTDTLKSCLDVLARDAQARGEQFMSFSLVKFDA